MKHTYSLFIMILFTLFSCDGGFDLRSSVSGPEEQALEVNYPTQVLQYEQITFDVTGGVPPYTYQASWPETTNDGLIYAPWGAGTGYTMTITDSFGAELICPLTVLARPDYIIVASNTVDDDDKLLPMFPEASSFDPGTPFIGTFQIRHDSGEYGHTSISWKVYISEETDLSGVYYIADAGSLSSDPGLFSNSPDISYSGIWPNSFTDYYLIIEIFSDDESEDAFAINNNMTNSSVYAPLRQTDYYITHIYSGNSFEAGTPMDNFKVYVKNNGPDDGETEFGWQVYLSTDNILDIGTDTEIASGAGDALPYWHEKLIPYTGTWPTVPGTYYLIAGITDGLDTDTTNNISVSGAITITPSVDYAATFEIPASSAVINTQYDSSFNLSQNGNGDDLSDVDWSLYISNNAEYSIGDPLLTSGTETGLTKGAAVDINYSFTWPSTTGYYYVVLVLSSAVDTNITNNAAVSSQIVLTN